MFNSQFDQDKYLETFVFKGYKNGFYVDVGAHDGVSINNTLYFEKYNNWTGINIEPIKIIFDRLAIICTILCAYVDSQYILLLYK